MPRIGGWILEENLEPLVDSLAVLAGERLDEGVRFLYLDNIGKSDSDANPPRWAECEFGGPQAIAGKIGVDQGTSVVCFDLDVPFSLSERLAARLALMQDYRLVSRS